MTILQGPWLNYMCTPDWLTQCCATAHKALRLTQTQDVNNRITLDVANQVLNLPPPIAATISSDFSIPLNILVPDGGVLTPITGLGLAFETVPGMALGNGKIRVPKTGRYRVTGSWQTNVDEATPVQGYSIGLSFDLSFAASGSGRYTSPLITGREEQTLGSVPGMALSAGDTIGLLGFTDYPGGVLVVGGFLGIEYIEGTRSALNYAHTA